MSTAPKRNIMRSFKMDEISAVTRPAQEHALATIMKRMDDSDIQLASIVKALAKDDATAGAQSFADLLAASEARQRQYEASEELWPLFCALQDSLRSIAADATLSTGGKLSAMQTSIDEFATTVRERFPDMEAEIEKLFTRDPLLEIVKAVGGSSGTTVQPQKEENMTDLAKKAAELEVQNVDLAKYVKTLEATIEKMKADEIAKNEETIVVAGETLRKSTLGAAAFAIIKGQQDDIAKAKEATELGVLEKKAETDFGNLPGEAIAKAKVLRAIGKMDEADRTELEKILKAANAVMKKAFTPVGQDGGGELAKADDELDNLAKVYATEHKVSHAKAYTAVLDTEHGRSLYAKSQNKRAA